ncbi:hypothetical protein TNCV_4428641 [Trichonephila clavipes]|nr:hypothetical protein TNCV_4428641 [Trichonephila clavipes]
MLNLSAMMKTTPELATPLRIATPRQREDFEPRQIWGDASSGVTNNIKAPCKVRFWAPSRILLEQEDLTQDLLVLLTRGNRTTPLRVKEDIEDISTGQWGLKVALLGGNVQNFIAFGKTATAGSDVVQSGRPIFDDFFQHLWPYIGNNTANVVFQMVKRLWLIRIDQ